MESGADNHYNTTVPCNTSRLIQAEAVNSCGKSIKAGRGVYVDCGDQFAVSPNPATNSVSLSENNSLSKLGRDETFDEVRIYDMQGSLKKYEKYTNAKQATIDISDLNNGNYSVEITNKSYQEKHQLIIQR